MPDGERECGTAAIAADAVALNDQVASARAVVGEDDVHLRLRWEVLINARPVLHVPRHTDDPEPGLP